MIEYAFAEGGGKRATHTCDITDMISVNYKLEVSTGTISEGQADELDWIVVRDEPDAQETLATEYQISATLPVGQYRNMRVVQRNLMYWVVDCPDTGSMELPSLNAPQLEPEEQAPISVVTPDGVWDYDDDGNFTLATPKETMSAFDVQQDTTTVLTWTYNFSTVDWLDNDDSGDWSDGDDVDNWTTVPGKTTMFDIEATYE